MKIIIPVIPILYKLIGINPVQNSDCILRVIITHLLQQISTTACVGKFFPINFSKGGKVSPVKTNAPSPNSGRNANPGLKNRRVGHRHTQNRIPLCSTRFQIRPYVSITIGIFHTGRVCYKHKLISTPHLRFLAHSSWIQTSRQHAARSKITQLIRLRRRIIYKRVIRQGICKFRVSVPTYYHRNRHGIACAGSTNANNINTALNTQKLNLVIQ